MNGSACLIVLKSGDVTRLTLNRPAQGNSLCAELVTALSAAIEAACGDGTRLLVVAANGKNFCTGFDLATLDSETDDSLLARMVRIELLLQKLHNAPVTTLALAQGRAMGAGADLFAACEQRWIVGQASFAFPGAAFGLVLGSARLAALIGPERARAWIASGASIGTEQALAANLATASFDAGTLGPEMDVLAVRARRLDGLTQHAIHQATLPRGASADADDLYRLVRSAAHPGLKERIVAYRKAAQQGRLE